MKRLASRKTKCINATRVLEYSKSTAQYCTNTTQSLMQFTGDCQMPYDTVEYQRLEDEKEKIKQYKIRKQLAEIDRVIEEIAKKYDIN
jgi:hypothetical protein